MEIPALQKAIEGVYEFYLSNGCPCRFPRFRKLVAFNSEDFGIVPTASLESHLLLDLALRGSQKIYRATSEPSSDQGESTWMHECSRCGARIAEHYAEYSINMFREYIAFVELKALDIGAPVILPLPVINGFFGFEPEPNQRAAVGQIFRWGATEAEFITYMTGMEPNPR